MSNNPFKKLKESEKKTGGNAQEFISNAVGETSPKEYKKPKIIYIPQHLVNRLNFYSETKAGRKESQNYIINEAISEWLEKRGF
ncbi:ribbon-helix-helix domain-containing protein [Campylobacter upsaliensis]|uniref:ribbon-helix-helix domain-containing protein n=1 Tax=Campylobacter upsaliensis TaxID=28080 RepID=UPI00214A4AA5|nr:ribbon-helix-helix domain-containing protein [Campylobacter upsaliensis]MCR2092222.1 ribbon-helix-helix domain-containing protein [Campylobacter upsaliensis]